MTSETLLPYYHDYGTDQQRLGRKIYREALSDRRGFREDQIGIDSEDEIWLDIFQNIGEVALKETRAQSPVDVADIKRDMLDDIENIAVCASHVRGICSLLIDKMHQRGYLNDKPKETVVPDGWQPLSEWHEDYGSCLFIFCKGIEYWGSEWTSPITYDADGTSFKDKYGDCDYVMFKRVDTSDFPAPKPTGDV